MNKNKKILLISALLIAIPTTFVIADGYMQDESYDSMDDDEHDSYHQESRMHKKEKKQQKKEIKMMSKLMKSLDLSPEQEEKIKSLMPVLSKNIQKNHHNESDDSEHNKKTKRSSDRGLLIGFMSEDEINQMVEKKNQEYKNSLMNRYSHAKAFLDILTEEQKTQLKEKVKSKMRY